MASGDPREDDDRIWSSWARASGHDVLLSYAPAFLDQIVPPPYGLTLAVGCGEGGIIRELNARSHNMVVLDASPTLVRIAREAGSGAACLSGEATALPFKGAAFQAIVAYRSLLTMTTATDLAKALHEAGRVIKFGGHLCMCVAHPMADVGRVEASARGGDIAITDSHFERRGVRETVSQDELEVTFHGWTNMLERYAQALEQAGFLIELVRDPAPSLAQVSQRPDLKSRQQAPLVLFVRAVKVPGTGATPR